MTEEPQYTPITAPKKDIHLPKDEQKDDKATVINKTEIVNNEEEEINQNITEEEENNEKNAEEEDQNKITEEEETKEVQSNAQNEEEESKQLNSEQLREEEEDQIESNLAKEENEKLNDMNELGVNDYDEEEEEYQITEPTQKPPPRSARASYNHPISPRTPRVPTEEELAKASSIATDLIVGNEVTETDPFILALTIRNLNERYIVLGDGGSYDDTVRCAHAIDAAKAKHRQVVIEMARNDSMNWVRIKKKQNKEDVKNWEDMNYRIQGTLNRKSKNAVNEMKRRHQEERQLFEEEWASETRMKYYNKASDQLRQLRRLQIRLLQDRKFEESERVKRIAQKLEKDEVAANMLAWSQAKREAFLLMENRQRKQMDTLVKSIEVKKDEFLARKKNENIVLANRRRALKIQEMDARNPEKNWIRHHRNEGDVAFKEVGPGQRIKIDSSAQKKNIFSLPMPTPPKTTASGAWRPITKKYKVTKLQPTKSSNVKDNNTQNSRNSAPRKLSSVSKKETSAAQSDNGSIANENKPARNENEEDINENEIIKNKNENEEDINENEEDKNENEEDKKENEEDKNENEEDQIENEEDKNENEEDVNENEEEKNENDNETSKNEIGTATD